MEGGIKGGKDVVGVVGVVPEFAGDEDFGAGDAALLDGLAYGGLGAVTVGGLLVRYGDDGWMMRDEHSSCVDVAVSGF